MTALIRPAAARLRDTTSLMLAAMLTGTPALSTQPTGESVSGQIQGSVRLATSYPIPPPLTVQNTTDPDACGRSHTLEAIVVSKSSRGLRDAIVALTDVAPETIPTRAAGRLVIDNTHCQFAPQVAVMTTGDTIEALNSDAVLHTVHLYGPFEVNLGLPLRGMRLSRRIDTPGLVIVKCDVHGWMEAFVRVDPHPFHAITDAQGSFRIADVPPGTYSLEAWHSKFGTLRQTVTVQSGQIGTVSVEFGATQSPLAR